METTGFIKLTWRCAFVIGVTLLLGHSYAQVSSTRDLHSWATALHTITLSQAVDSDIIAKNYGRATAQLQTATLDIPLQGTLSSCVMLGFGRQASAGLAVHTTSNANTTTERVFPTVRCYRFQRD
jgi:hypothetical protein